MKSFINTFAFLAKAIIAGAFLAQAHGAGYIKFDGIDGEAADKDHRGWSELLSFSQGIERAGTRYSPSFHDIVVTTMSDKSTPKLAEAICKGIVIPRVTIEFIHETVEGREAYFQWELKNVRVTSYQFGFGGNGTAEAGSSVPTESFSLNYEEIKWTYNTADEGGNVEFEWKVEEGESVAGEDGGEGSVGGPPEQPKLLVR